MAKKKRFAKATTSNGVRSKSSASGLRVIVDPTAKPSPAAKQALRLFSDGVQRAYKDLAKHRVKTVVIEDGKPFKAVPRLSKGRFVVERLRRKA
jgi:hypothetical protein